MESKESFLELETFKMKLQDMHPSLNYNPCKETKMDESMSQTSHQNNESFEWIMNNEFDTVVAHWTLSYVLIYIWSHEAPLAGFKTKRLTL